MQINHRTARGIEWPTLAMIGICYASWFAGLFVLANLSLWFTFPVLALAGALHSSLTHEAIHGHPFRSAKLNAALVALPLSFCVPYGRFRDQHLAHHHDEILTDPYDDPESNFLDPAVWAALPRAAQIALRLNNTLAGRIIIGPILGQALFMLNDLRAIRSGDHAARNAWLIHMPLAALVLIIVLAAPIPIWVWLLSVWLGLGLLKIRTFLEHRAHERARARTVVIEDQGPLALLFLNNNFHVVHHMHPHTPWYRLPALYRANRAHYLGRNDGYRYASYAEVFRQHFLHAKDPVPHPLFRR